MRLRIGCRLAYDLPQPTPMIALLNVHFSRFGDLERPDYLVTTPSVPIGSYRDGFGNWCSRLVAPAGRFELSTDGVVRDDGGLDRIDTMATQSPVENLPDDALTFLLGSRYCETDRLLAEAWQLFAGTEPGWARVQAICDFVHGHITFGYQHARATRTAAEAYEERIGVCRDFTHLAIAFCRCMNIPARYCTGYISEIGQPEPQPPGDFAAWMEVYLGGAWHTFDPRNNEPRVGRVLIARGRDAADVPLTCTFGPTELVGFEVWTDPI